MKKIGIITFHAAYNYGSLLQNYALQKVLAGLGFCPETINLRTRKQKEQYDYFTPIGKLLDKKRIILYLAFFFKKNELKQKYALFENFLSEDLALSQEVADTDGIRSLPLYDAYVAGSDQIWNVGAKDFNWSYFLDFVPKGIPRVSYAASMGTCPDGILDGNDGARRKVRDCLLNFNAISVRETKTAKVINKILPERDCEVLIDPTLLLEAKCWEQHIAKEPIISGDYIFLYNPYFIKDVYEQARLLSKMTGLKVVVSNVNIKSSFYYPEFKSVLATGPWEFLNLIKNATYVIGRSFHLLVFSLLFEKTFIAVNGLGDSRLSNLLSLTGLESLASRGAEDLQKIIKGGKVDFTYAFDAIKNERTKALDFLSRNLK